MNTYGKDVDIVFESKMKELALLRLQGEEPTITPQLAKLMNRQKKQDPEVPLAGIVGPSVNASFKRMMR